MKIICGIINPRNWCISILFRATGCWTSSLWSRWTRCWQRAQIPAWCGLRIEMQCKVPFSRWQLGILVHPMHVAISCHRCLTCFMVLCTLTQVRALFSASLSETVEDLARTIMHAPVRVTVGKEPYGYVTALRRSACASPPLPRSDVTASLAFIDLTKLCLQASVAPRCRLCSSDCSLWATRRGSCSRCGRYGFECVPCMVLEHFSLVTCILHASFQIPRFTQESLHSTASASHGPTGAGRGSASAGPGVRVKQGPRSRAAQVSLHTWHCRWYLWPSARLAGGIVYKCAVSWRFLKFQAHLYRRCAGTLCWTTFQQTASRRIRGRQRVARR